MHATRPHLSRHRRQRIVLWLLTVLAWAASVIGASDAPRMHRRGVFLSPDWLSLIIKRLVLIRGAELSKRRVRKVRGKVTRPAGFMRAVFGARLRCALRHPDPATRIVRMRRVVEQLDLWALRLARRLKSGATKLQSRKFAYFVVALEQGAPRALLPADSS